jgi:transcriptional regulator with XRE-family HTH domain
MEERSCHARPCRKDSVIVPPNPAPGSFGSDTAKVPQGRLANPFFPTRDSRLLDAGDRGQFLLGDLEYLTDSTNGVHADQHMQICMKKAIRKSDHALAARYTNPYNSGMEISRVIRELLEVRGWTQEKLAESLDVAQSNVSRWLSGVEPRGGVRDRLLEMAHESGVIEQERGDRTVIPIMGRIGAGAEILPEFEQVPPDGLNQVELPFYLGDDVIGFEVEGDSMLPKYESGVVVVVFREQTRSTSSLVGELAAIRTADGHRYLKIIMPSSKPHLYNLQSFNASTKPIIGARIVWASDIIATIEPRHVRHIGRTKPTSPSARTHKRATK